jgi:3-hydroxybutyryl-CoA dehydratase
VATYRDLPEGHVFRTDGWTITEAHVVAFAGLTGDHFKLHTDEHYARTTEFGARIVHGPLIYSTMMGQLYQSRVFVDAALALLGVDRLRHLAPCYLGTSVYTVAKITHSRPTKSGDKAIVRADVWVEDQDATKLMECEVSILVRATEDDAPEPARAPASEAMT